MAQYNTTLEAAGAEHLVIGQLLIDRIQAFRAHSNQPGYDLLAVDPTTRSSTKIQVKSRVATDSGPWDIRSFDFDFAVLVRLNRGTKASLKAGQPEKTCAPEFYVVPKSAIDALKGTNNKIRIRKSQLPQFLGGWSAIRTALITAAV